MSDLEAPSVQPPAENKGEDYRLERQIGFLLRRAHLYTPVVLNGGSMATAAVACYWFVERAFAI